MGCDIVRAEKASGARRDGRTGLQVLLDFLRPGDTLVVTPGLFNALFFDGIGRVSLKCHTPTQTAL